jgi:hypothetical protein
MTHAKTTRKWTWRIPVLVVAGAFLFSGCGGGEKDAMIRKKLEVIAAADLRAITAELPRTSLADTVYYRIVKYSTYQKGQFGVRAVVDYYYLRDVTVKRMVKYRYVKDAGKWERYDNEYRFFSDTTGR